MSCKGLFFSAALVCQWGLLLWITSPKFCNLKSVNESKSLLFMSPIILKYLPFCTSQLPVSLQCDKRLLAPGLNPFLLCPVSSSISARNRHHINLFFLLKSCCLHFFFFFTPLPQEVVYSGWLLWESYEHFDQVSVTLFNILFRSMCVKSVYLSCYMFDFSVWRETIHACSLALCMSVWYRASVCAVCMFIGKRGKEMKFNAEWIMEYVLLSAVCSSECLSEWNSCEKLLCVLGIVSGTAWIACGCLPGLIPLNSTISFHSLSTKTCPPAKVHFHCFYHHFFKRKQNCEE